MITTPPILSRCGSTNVVRPGCVCSRSRGVKWSLFHQLIRRLLAASLFLAGLGPSQAVWAQLPKVSAPKQSPPSQAPESAQDPLGRTTPRGTVLGFLSASYDHKFDVAAQYLDTRARGNDAATLAEQLFHVLDRKLTAKINNLSNDPQGSLSDPLDVRRELVGTVAGDSGPVQIYLQREDRPNSSPVWLFSRQTLSAIPDIYEEINANPIELPPFLLTRLFGFPLFGWLFFLAGLPLLYVILGILNRLLVSAWGYGLVHWAKRPSPPDIKVLPIPVRLLALSIAVHLMRQKFSLSFLARQVGSIVETIILIVGLVWLAILANGRCEAYLKRRMEKQGRLASTAILRPTRRVIDVIFGVIGLMVALHTFGVNPSAAIAGLGVGGIAVALAAQKTLENVIGGASIILDEAVRVGDYFKMGTVEGTVEAIGLRSTLVRTMNRTLVTIPNGQIATMTLENFSARDSFWFRHIVGIGYDTPSSTLGLILTEVRALLEQDQRVLPATTRVRFLRFAEWSLDFEIYAYIGVRDNNQFLEVQEDLLIKIRQIIESAEARIAFPSRTIYLKSETEKDAQPSESFHKLVRGREP
jgi:MscS family membrane protein